jgi:hypothetical protein
MLGSHEQSKAIEKAAQQTESWQDYLVALEERRYDDAARFRNIAYKTAQLQLGGMKTAMPLMQQYAKATPGTSPAYQNALRMGTRSLMSNLAPYGLSPSSSTAGQATGELGANLLATDWQNILNTQKALAGYAPNASPTQGAEYMGLLGQAGSAQSDVSNLLGMQGATKGGMYGNLGNMAMQMPLYYSLLNYMNPKT